MRTDQQEGLTLFEPSVLLPEGIQGVPSLSKGPRLAVQLDNHTDKEVVLTPEWTIGQVYPVQLVVKPPPEGGPALPEIPRDLNLQQQRQLEKLLDRYSDVLCQKGDPITSTPLIEHEIHTTGPPIRQPSRRQNPLIREQEQKQVQEMLRDGVIRPSVSPCTSPVVMVKK